jgi:hypothetical protein
LYSFWNAWANLHLLGQHNTFLAQARAAEDLLGRFGLAPQTKAEKTTNPSTEPQAKAQPKPEAAAPKKGMLAGKKSKGGHGPKPPTQAVQHVKTIEMQKETIAKKDAEAAKKDAEVAQLRAENARLRGGTHATGQPTQEPAPAPAKPASKKEPKSPARQRPASPRVAEVGSPLKRPPSLHVMAQRASALSPGRTRSSGGSPQGGASV